VRFLIFKAFILFVPCVSFSSFCGTGIWTQGFMFANQVFYCLQSFLFCLFWRWGSILLCSEKVFCMVSILSNLLRLDLRHRSSMPWIFHVQLKSLCILHSSGYGLSTGVS
jgi:hypothetical protein